MGGGSAEDASGRFMARSVGPLSESVCKVECEVDCKIWIRAPVGAVEDTKVQNHMMA